MKAIRVAAASAERMDMPEDQGSQVWLANESLTGASLSVIRLLLRPGQSGGRHRHPNADEVICLFRGSVRVHTPTEAILLQPGDGLTVLAGLTHQIENVGVRTRKCPSRIRRATAGTSPSDGVGEQKALPGRSLRRSP